MGDESHRNGEIERIANMMMHDGISPDEQDAAKLAEYARQVRVPHHADRSDLPGSSADDPKPVDKSADDEEAMNIVYEALLYRKLRSASSSENILDRGSEFGAGFS